jgi:hypothetical protein
MTSRSFISLALLAACADADGSARFATFVSAVDCERLGERSLVISVEHEAVSPEPNTPFGALVTFPEHPTNVALSATMDCGTWSTTTPLGTCVRTVNAPVHTTTRLEVALDRADDTIPAGVLYTIDARFASQKQTAGVTQTHACP